MKRQDYVKEIAAIQHHRMAAFLVKVPIRWSVLRVRIFTCHVIIMMVMVEWMTEAE